MTGEVVAKVVKRGGWTRGSELEEKEGLGSESGVPVEKRRNGRRSNGEAMG